MLVRLGQEGNCSITRRRINLPNGVYLDVPKVRISGEKQIGSSLILVQIHVKVLVWVQFAREKVPSGGVGIIGNCLMTKESLPASPCLSSQRIVSFRKIDGVHPFPASCQHFHFFHHTSPLFVGSPVRSNIYLITKF